MKVFKIKIGKTWSKVTASSIIALNAWAEANNVKDWRMVGMQSLGEMSQNKNLTFVG